MDYDNIWRPISLLAYEKSDVHWIVILSNGKIIVTMRNGFSIIDQAALYYPLPDPPAIAKIYVEPDNVENINNEQGVKQDGTDH